MKKYNLEGNLRLFDLFEERHMWVTAFMKEYFWAGMKTTHRVESINSFFDGFVNRKTKLYEFPDRYARAMERRVRAENDADARCGKYVRRLVSGFNVEKFFQEIYTDTKFQEVHTKCVRLMHCYGRDERVLDGNVIQYLLKDRVWIIPEGKSEEIITDKRRLYCVKFNTITKDVSCDCRKFETFGILCRHVIRVYGQNLVFHIPKKYVLDRWRKDVVRKHTRVKVAYHDPSQNLVVQTYNIMMVKFEPICEEASTVDDKETVDLVINTLQTLRLDVKKGRQKHMESQPCLPPLPRTLLPPSEIGSNSHIQTDLIPKSVNNRMGEVTETVKVPVSRKKPRGRPKGSRHKTLAERGWKKKNTKTTTDNAEKGEGSAMAEPPEPSAKRKKSQFVLNQNTIENYYDYVQDVD